MSKERHNFLKEYKLFKACEKEDALRQNMERVYFQGGNAYATDAHIMVKVPLAYCTTFEDEEILALNGFCIHHKLLKMLYDFDVVTIERTMAAEDAYGNLLEQAEEVVYIKVVWQGQQIRFRLERSDKEFVQNFETILATETGHTPIKQIGISPSRLKQIAEAINMDHINMAFTTAKDKIFIRSTNEEDQKAGPMAIIMPIVTDATLPGMDGDEEEEGNE